MTAFRALETAIGSDLAEFSRLLWVRRLPHRIFDEASGRQVLMVTREEHVALVRELYARWRSGELSGRDLAGPSAKGLAEHVTDVWRAQPLTLCIIVLSVLGGALCSFDTELRWLHWFTFSDFQVHDQRLVFESAAASQARGQYWRLLTPVFLHFGALHLAFNLLWYWEFGRRLERVRGRMTALAVLLITGAGGNIAQYMIDGSVLFGGLSGVIYGLLGYAWMWTRLSGDRRLALPRGVLVFMLTWLLICMSGVLEVLGFGAVANAAHGAGLVLGMLLGLAAALLYSPPRHQER